ncbi:unnamed protein product [Mytilus coruscus]|uniref:Apple domain-containing protein n=1 Tax=Mytilus coruscus TaxID=42192 RepID=A0A6J8ECN6_MYTCO|nr:unnamed protein product [Mytilus coruscus]
MTTARKGPVPEYQWPLGNKSLLTETMSRVDFVREPVGDCYKFEKKPDPLPFDAMSFGQTSDDLKYLKTNLRDDSEFKNLSISMFVYPIGTPKGTLLHYVLGQEEKIRINFIMTHTVVSFRDEYANPTGLVAEEDLLKENEWNHLYIERQFESGRIKIYVNGKEKVNANDDFQKNIPMPTGGTVYLGNAVAKGASEDDQQFTGYITCFQIYTGLVPKDNINEMWKNCLQKNWKYQPPEFYLISNENLKCVSSTPPTTPAPPPISNLVTRNILGIEKEWNEFRHQFNWKTSPRTTGYFIVKAHDMKPSPFSFGIVNATDTRVCSRLCMRIEGCQSFSMDERTVDYVTCHMYNSVYGDLVADPGSKYYTIVNVN